MKKATLLIALLTLLFTLNSHAQNKKVAVITFYAVKQVGISEFGSMAQLAEKLSDNPAFDLTPLLKSFHTQFFDTYSKEFPFTLMPEDQVLNNEAYKSFTPVGSETTGISITDKYNIPYPGYKVVLPLVGHGNEENLLKIFNQADGVMKVYVNFDLVKIGLGGMGVVKITAHANIALFNKAGDKVFSVKEDARSKNMSPLVGGVPVMTPEKILPMCESAMTELMADLEKDMPKMIKKADSKL